MLTKDCTLILKLLLPIVCARDIHGGEEGSVRVVEVPVGRGAAQRQRGPVFRRCWDQCYDFLTYVPRRSCLHSDYIGK
jgi:hypothetical protein